MDEQQYITTGSCS